MLGKRVVLLVVSAFLPGLLACGDETAAGPEGGGGGGGGAAGVCGDGNVDAGEQCDDGNGDPGDGCSAGCTNEALASCGDGIADPGEECDLGALNSDTSPGTCRLSCTLPRCGDGVVDPGEACDDAGAPGGCPEGCTLGVTCGDGLIQLPEECDDGGTTGGDGCSELCLVEGRCGDGFPDAGEACDDGNRIAGDGCELDCSVTPICGDGALDPGEECDDGNLAPGDGCSGSCALEGFCGNGAPDPGEQCDDGNVAPGDGCDASCILEALPACGDGFLDRFEECDDGNLTAGDGCDASCTVEPAGFCGNGILDPGELCDDGNNSNGDGCNESCTSAEICGDGVLNPGELCDDGNLTDFDGCSSACNWEVGLGCGVKPLVDLSASGTPDGAGGYDYAGSTAGAPNDARTTRCNAGASSGDVVHAFVAPGGYDVTFSTVDPGTTFASALYVRTVCNNAATEVGCDAPGAGGATVEILDAPAGTPYYAYVDGIGGASGSYVLHVSLRAIAGAGEACDGVTARCDDSLSCAGGVCAAPTCGDGVIGPGEQCDDGNLLPGDGCDAACGSEVTGCGALPAALDLAPFAGPAGASHDGTVVGQGADTSGSCVDPSGPELAFAYRVPERADVTLSTDFPQTSYDSVLYVRGVCDDPASELPSPGGIGGLSCNDDIGGGNTRSRLALADLPAGTLLYVYVDTYGNGAGGSYHLEISLTPVRSSGDPCDPDGAADRCEAPLGCIGGLCAVNACGDGFLGAGEGCDDGNLLPGDGCDAACAVEAGFCPGTVDLDLAGTRAGNELTYSGDSTGAPSAGNTRSCGGQGPEVNHSYTLTQRADLVVTSAAAFGHADSVRTDCADVATELACASTLLPQTLTIQDQAAGTLLAVRLDGFAGQQGPYTLTLREVAISGLIGPCDGGQTSRCETGLNCTAGFCVP